MDLRALRLSGMGTAKSRFYVQTALDQWTGRIRKISFVCEDYTTFAVLSSTAVGLLLFHCTCSLWRETERYPPILAVTARRARLRCARHNQGSHRGKASKDQSAS